ncbi:MAG TPA: ester cyclase [candidate division Zixibacteria bacterium]|nr:ester cyclase [candidate division Zixibacteria bacterium]
MPEENKAIVRRFYEEFANQGIQSVAEELVASDFVDHNPPSPEFPPGLEGLKQVFAMFLVAFPDMNLTVEDQIAEGDKVVTRLTTRGTHKGEFMGIPPTGKTMTIGLIDIFRIEGGQLAEHWGESDTMGMMQQLGLGQSPGE